MSRKDVGIGIAIGVLSGAAIGAALALLYAPRSGSETRAMLREKANDLKERASDLKDCIGSALSGNKGEEQG